MNTEEANLVERMMEDLRAYGRCCVCAHCDKDKYPAQGYCELGGCNGGGSGEIAEDRWTWGSLRRAEERSGKMIDRQEKVEKPTVDMRLQDLVEDTLGNLYEAISTAKSIGLLLYGGKKAETEEIDSKPATDCMKEALMQVRDAAECLRSMLDGINGGV